jgi:post-segregation antitoxin (ccd killing protein)
MLVKVEVSPATRRVIIKELRKLKGDNWNLGTNEGTISTDGKSMSGTAKDAKGKSYSWSFTRK